MDKLGECSVCFFPNLDEVVCTASDIERELMSWYII